MSARRIRVIDVPDDFPDLPEGAPECLQYQYAKAVEAELEARIAKRELDVAIAHYTVTRLHQNSTGTYSLFSEEENDEILYLINLAWSLKAQS